MGKFIVDSADAADIGIIKGVRNEASGVGAEPVEVKAGADIAGARSFVCNSGGTTNEDA